jgi:hypothetical protein
MNIEDMFHVRKDAAGNRDLKEFNCPIEGCTYGYAWVLEEPRDHAEFEWKQGRIDKVIGDHLRAHDE